MNDDEEYVDCLDHVMRVANASHTQSRRLRWIAHRCKCALEGGDWREVQLPKMHQLTDREQLEIARVDSLCRTAKTSAAIILNQEQQIQKLEHRPTQAQYDELRVEIKKLEEKQNGNTRHNILNT